jgi:hypothetical protein
MQVGRRGAQALMLIAVDEAPSQDQLDAIEAIAGFTASASSASSFRKVA